MTAFFARCARPARSAGPPRPEGSVALHASLVEQRRHVRGFERFLLEQRSASTRIGSLLRSITHRARS